MAVVGAVALPAVRGIRGRKDIKIDLEHRHHLVKAASWMSASLLSFGVATQTSPTTDDQQKYALDKTNLKQHPFATFGCTTCHYGQGRDLVQTNAHGSIEKSLTPLLPANVRHNQATIQNIRLWDYRPLQQVFDHPFVHGALVSLLGPDYYLHLHRHVHYNSP